MMDSLGEIGPQTPPPVNPLMIDLILEKIFGHFGSTELANCRRVNQSWYRVAEPYWLSTLPTILLFANSTRDITKQGSHSDKKAKLSGFLQLVPTTDDDDDNDWTHRSLRRHTKFGLYFDKFGHVESEGFHSFRVRWANSLTHFYFGLKELSTLALFMDVLSCKRTPKLEVLQIHCKLSQKDIRNSRRIASEEAFAGNLIPEVNEVKPNLRSLEIRVTTGKVEEATDQLFLPVNWRRQLVCYPNLEHLSVNFENDQFREQLLEIANNIMLVRQIGEKTNWKLSALKSFDICYLDSFRKQTFPESPLFLDDHLKLEKFAFSFGLKATEPLVQNFLKTQKATLQQLTYRLDLPGEHFNFPESTPVRKLTLEGLPQEGLSWLRNLPNLESLKLRRRERSDKDGTCQSSGSRLVMWMMYMGGSSLPSITTFHCDYLWNFEEGVLTLITAQLIKWFPTLKRLRFHIVNGTFYQICEGWPRLEELNCIGGEGELDEVGICGRESLESRMFRKCSGVPFNPELHQTKLANITHLKELRVFTMEPFFNTVVKPKIYDASVYYGFLKCTKLEKVKVAMRSSGHEGDEAKILKDLKTKIPRGQIRFVKCGRARLYYTNFACPGYGRD